MFFNLAEAQCERLWEDFCEAVKTNNYKRLQNRAALYPAYFWNKTYRNFSADTALHIAIQNENVQ